MSDSYLKLAEHILETRGRPMSAQQILIDAKRFSLLPEHLSGQTMQKTLQARIAEDIYTNRSNSIFYRTNVGTYFLRLLSDDKSLPNKLRSEYSTKSRSKPLPSDRVLFIKQNSIKDEPSLIKAHREGKIEDFTNAYYYLGIEPDNFLKVITFCIIEFEGKLLLHQTGKFSHFVDVIGKKSIGFRRFIDEYDVDLFGDDNFGAKLSAAREINHHLYVGNFMIDDRDIRNRMSFIGAIIEPEARRFSLALHINLTNLPHFSGEIRRRLEVANPHWRCKKEIEICSLDRASQLTFNLISPT